MIDDRIVLPLSEVRVAARLLCNGWCPRFPGEHTDPCLVPLLDARDALLAAAPELHRVSGDCQDPVKHGACSGCSCTCHRHSSRGSR